MSNSNPKSNALDKYLATRHKAARMQILNGMQGNGEHLPISLAEDLLVMPLGPDEHMKILELTGSNDRLALEQFYTRSLGNTQQDLASLAILLWRDHTDHLMWYQFYPYAADPLLSQRVRYTLLDNLWHTGGRLILDQMLTLEGIEDLSAAFHGLLLHRAVEWDVKHPRLDRLTANILSDLSHHLHPDNKATISALNYLGRHQPKELNQLVTSPTVSEPWKDYLRSGLNSQAALPQLASQLEKLAQKPPKTKVFEKLASFWPAMWMRHQLNETSVTACLELVASQPFEEAKRNSRRLIISHPFELFAGVPTSTLMAAAANLESQMFAKSLKLLGSLLPMTLAEDFKQRIKNVVASADNPADCLEQLPMRLRIDLTTDTTDLNSPFAKLHRDQVQVLKGKPTTVDFQDSAEATSQDVKERKSFFQAYRGQETKPDSQAQTYWGSLHHAWNSPERAALDSLASKARQEEGLFRICYLDTLARFHDHDEAVLKVLDFIRSTEDDDIRAVIRALSGIGTARAQQELVASLTRPNVNHAHRLEICSTLQGLDMQGLQKELRAALNDLSSDPDSQASLYEIQESLASLLQPQDKVTQPSANKSTTSQIDASDQALDKLLAAKIPHYKELSSEVKRALRTAQFFHMQVSASGAPESIDLSPVIDMQYKSLELLFRESFEDSCSRLIHKGVLQRRLDVIGYARPIPRSMDDFENYVSSLPTIREIPFFSKFKLRKMLRAICQFRPGRRFTLDGLKAFALFFLCFSRQDCRYGLGLQYPLGLGSDQDLFAFCKSLHVLQDARNRAAHEGFHPDASNDIDSIWQATAEIVQTVFQITPNLVDQVDDYAPKNRSTPIIEKKVS